MTTPPPESRLRRLNLREEWKTKLVKVTLDQLERRHRDSKGAPVEALIVMHRQDYGIRRLSAWRLTRDRPRSVLAVIGRKRRERRESRRLGQSCSLKQQRFVGRADLAAPAWVPHRCQHRPTVPRDGPPAGGAHRGGPRAAAR